jgi:Mrp family chromosome partitioning ATPase/tetratricopeptide (TPR) repeat protein
MSGASAEGATSGERAQQSAVPAPSANEAATKVVAVLGTATGAGCTSTVANLAFLLARAGRSVLVVDWGSEAPRVPEYLESFELSPVGLPDGLAGALTTVHGGPPEPEDDRSLPVTRFTFPETAGHVDVVTTPGGNGAARPSPPGAIADLRRELPSSGYHDVLIDAPSGSSDPLLTLIASLADLAIVCFHPRPRAIADAAELAARLRRAAPVGIGVVPVATDFDDRYQPRLERLRDAIRTTFGDLLADRRSREFGASAVEIPYRAWEKADPLLSVLVEEPSPDNQLLAAYGRLAAIIGDAGGAAASVPPGLRARYRRTFGIDSGLDADRILIACAAPDRPWADWVRGRLERSGAQTRPLRRGQGWLADARPPGLVVISSAALDRSPELAAVDQAIADAHAAGRPLNVFRILIGERPGVEPDGAWAPVTAGSEQRLVARLLDFFGLIERPSAEPTRGSRLPGDRPEVFNAPPRNPRFIGRDDDIEELRDRFVEPGDGPAAVTLTGAPGVGKSELALEYAYRFSADYDLVWWVPAGDEQSTMVSLAGLAARLNVPGSHNYGSTAALDKLATDRTYARFLLIYDNVGDLTELDGLLPSADPGHILITSSGGEPAQIELAAMTPADSSALLTSRVHGISSADAARVADAAGHLPLALELAGTWLAEVAENARRGGDSVAGSASRAVHAFFQRRGVEPDPGPGSWQEGVVARVVAVVAANLRETAIGRLALLLAQMCSFLNHDGIGLDLVRSAAMLDQLLADGGSDAAPLRLDAGEIDRVLWTGVRHGLFHVAWGRQNSLRIHRVVQAALRDAMGSAESSARRAGMLAALATYAPNEVDEPTPAHVARFTELQRHVVWSGATDSDDDQVRRWLVNQARFLVTQGGHGVHKAALVPAQKLLDVWTSRYGSADPLRLRLAHEVANLYRAVGDFTHAYRLDDAALAIQRGSYELNHPRTLLSALGRGGDLRGLGLFAEALEEDLATWQGLREVFGEEHPRTRMAVHNLASAMYLSGDVLGALGLAESNYRLFLRLLGEDDIKTWASLTQVGIYRRELGEFEAARHALRQVAQRVRRLRPELNAFSALVQWQQAVVLRCEGRATAAKQSTGEALNALRELLGDDHPNTLACQLSYAAAHRAVGGEPATPIELAAAVRDGYLRQARLAEDHPFVALSRIGLGLARCAAGLDGSADTGAALRLLYDKLGDAHPWALAAAVDHASVLGRTGNATEAADLADAAHEGCLEFLGDQHPHTVIAAHNRGLATDPDAGGDRTWKEIDVDVPES